MPAFQPLSHAGMADGPGHPDPAQPGLPLGPANLLAAGQRAAVLAGSSAAARAELLGALMAKLPGAKLRVGNPLASALTLHRLLIQLGTGLDGGLEGSGLNGAGLEDGSLEAGGQDAAALLLRVLDRLADPDGSVVLAVEDAHTLAGDALAALARVPSGSADGSPGRLLILSGAPDLLRMLRDPGLASLRDPAHALTVPLDAAAEAALREDGAQSGAGPGTRSAKAAELPLTSAVPNTIQPSTADFGTAYAGTAQPRATDPGSGQPRQTQSGEAQSGKPSPGKPSPGKPSPGWPSPERPDPALRKPAHSSRHHPVSPRPALRHPWLRPVGPLRCLAMCRGPGIRAGHAPGSCGGPRSPRAPPRLPRVRWHWPCRRARCCPAYPQRQPSVRMSRAPLLPHVPLPGLLNPFRTADRGQAP